MGPSFRPYVNTVMPAAIDRYDIGLQLIILTGERVQYNSFLIFQRESKVLIFHLLQVR